MCNVIFTHMLCLYGYVYYGVCITLYVLLCLFGMCTCLCVMCLLMYHTICHVSCTVIQMCTLHAVQEDTVHNYYKWKVHVGTLEHDHSVVGDGVFE